MKYFIDNNNQTWGYEDDAPQEIIDNAQSDNNITFTSLTEAEFQNAVAPNLADAKIIKIDEIEIAFTAAEVLPVSAVDVEWNGGYTASAKYKTGYDFAELSDQPTVDFKDTAGTRHTLSLADAKTVLLAIGADYLTKDALRDDLIAQVNAATTNNEVAAVAISF